MKPAAPASLPLLRSQLQADLLVRLFIGQVEESVTELASAIGAHAGNTLREVERLESGDIVTTRRVGRTRLVRANPDAPFYRSLRELIVITMGPAQVLTEVLEDLPGVESASLVGSWAVEPCGDGSDAPSDVRILVVGTPEPDELGERLAVASRRLGRDVVPTLVSPAQWRSPHDRIVRALSSQTRRPLIERPPLLQSAPVTALPQRRGRGASRFSVVDLLGAPPAEEAGHKPVEDQAS